jgi:hypothetical protein
VLPPGLARTHYGTTPKPIKIIRELIADPTTVITRGSTCDNRANLTPAFLQQIAFWRLPCSPCQASPRATGPLLGRFSTSSNISALSVRKYEGTRFGRQEHVRGANHPDSRHRSQVRRHLAPDFVRFASDQRMRIRDRCSSQSELVWFFCFGHSIDSRN